MLAAVWPISFTGTGGIVGKADEVINGNRLDGFPAQTEEAGGRSASGNAPYG